VTRSVLVTGGNRGIGLAIARRLAADGDSVTVTSRSGALVEGLSVVTCDVRDAASVDAAFTAVEQEQGPVEVLVANAGITQDQLLALMKEDAFTDVLDTNLTGIFLTCKHGLQQMLAAKVSGSIVCTSSPTGFVALAAGGSGAYSATKGAISSLVRCMAIDYARFGIRVNAVVPGATETGLMWNNVPPEEVEAMRVQLRREIPLGRLAEAEDPARVVAWLLSEESVYMTGSHVVCDGGILAKSSISV